MAYILQVNFESNWELYDACCVFKFRGRDYKLLRGKGQKTNKELDCVLSILDKDDEKKCYEVCRDIMIYLGCLSWENNASIKVSPGGGYGSSNEIKIKKVRRFNVTKRTSPAYIHSLKIERIPYVYNRDQEDAIGLYREALASNNSFFRFLCLWNILNIPTKKPKQLITWINDTMKYKKNKIHQNHHINELLGKGINIGQYLNEECRDAIAHIRRYPATRRHIDPNNFEDLSEIAANTHFLEDLVKIYAKEELQLNKIQFLYKTKSRDIHEYLTEEEIEIKLFGKILRK